MNNLTKEQVNDFAQKKNVSLSTEELDFTYSFVKKNWEQIIGNPSLLNIDRYKNKFSEENFVKVKRLFEEYFQKYHNYL